MRTIEALILLILLIRWIAGLAAVSRRSRWVNWLSVLASVLVIIHLVVEGYRLQMLPAYGLTLVFLMQSLRRIRRRGLIGDAKAPHRVRSIAGFTLGLLVLSLAVALPLLLPVFSFPEPTGPYPVGTTKLHLVDRTRPETFTPDPNDNRELMVQAWYPAEPVADAMPAPYRENAASPFSHLSLVRTHSHLDVPLSGAQPSYPVLVFSHGYFGFAEQNLTQMEELASHGYVVFSIAHPYHAQEVNFPDGRTIRMDSKLWDDYCAGRISASEKAQHLSIWTDDTVYLIDELEAMQAHGRENVFVGKLDLDRLGVFGMSFGGTTAIRVCSIDHRCRAVANLDGSLPDGPKLEQPLLSILNAGRQFYVRSVLNAGDDEVVVVTVHGTTHQSFTDVVRYSPLFRYTAAFGPIDSERIVTILNAYAVAFFGKQLKGKTAPLLDGPSPDFPELDFRSKSPGHPGS